MEDTQGQPLRLACKTAGDKAKVTRSISAPICTLQINWGQVCTGRSQFLAIRNTINVGVRPEVLLQS